MKRDAYVTVGVYLDTTPYYGNELYDNGDDNYAAIRVQFGAVEDFFNKFVKGYGYNDITALEWMNDEYTLDEMDGFYSFCLENGFDMYVYRLDEGSLSR